MRNKSWLPIIIVGILLIPLFFPVSQVEIRNYETGKVIISTPIEEGDILELSWIHSIEKTPWLERYQVEDDQWILKEVRVKSFGAGVDVEAPVVEVKDGWTVMREMNRSFSKLRFLYSRNVNYTMYINGLSVDLPGQIPHHTPVDVRIRKIPRIIAVMK